MTFITKYRRSPSFLRLMKCFFVPALVCLAVAAHAQVAQSVTSATPGATRAQLAERLDSLQRVDAARGSVAQRRSRAEETAALRTRLERGDMQVGDRFLLNAGFDAKTDTVIVRENEMIALLNWPSYSLHGVLRSELQDAMTRYVGTYLREPRLRVYPLTRIAIAGAVARPGYFAVDPARPLSDAIMSSGGPVQSAQYDKISVYRGGTRIMDEKNVTRALRDGRTVDEIGLQSGDQVRVAARKSRNWGPIIQATLIGVTAFSALLALVRSSYAN